MAATAVAWEIQVRLALLGCHMIGNPKVLGLPREAVTSLELLREATHDAIRALEEDASEDARRVRQAIDDLEALLAPVVIRWRPVMQAHEATRPAGHSLSDHYAGWPHTDELLADLRDLSEPLLAITATLESVTGACLELPLSP